MAADETIPSPVRELRDSFGDRKLPDISRKIVACVACRKMKIKCNMRDQKPPCARCKKRGLSCTVNRSLQMLLEDSVTWKDSMGRKVQTLQKAVQQISEKLSMPEVSALLDHNVGVPRQDDEASDNEHGPTWQAPGQPHPQHAWEVVMDAESDIPASCVSEVPNTNLEDPRQKDGRGRVNTDLIGRNVISRDQAQMLFDHYYTRLDHFLYGILGDHKNLNSIRTASPLLTAAVCTVGALHCASTAFEVCYQEFTSLSSECALSKRNTVDDLRGLIIAAFWLSDLSWALVGAAVRIATELQLHRCLALALQGDRNSYFRIRLYFHVYVCDHHFSIAYGRPPMTRECYAIRNAARLLESKHAIEDDARLISQVKIWSISSQIFETFDADFDVPVSATQMPHLRRLSIALDSWRADWNERFTINKHVGNYPRKGVGLHYHFAKLYLCSHAFRGALKPGGVPHQMSSETEEFANMAVLSAQSIIRVVISDTEIQSHLHGLPTYFDTMIAFAVVFLLKLATMYSGTVCTNRDEIFASVDQVVTVLKSVTSQMHKRHILVSIAVGFEKLLDRCKRKTQSTTVVTTPAVQRYVPLDTTPGNEFLNGGQDWMISPSESSFILGNYDFLAQQDMINNWDFNFNDFSFQQGPTV